MRRLGHPAEEAAGDGKTIAASTDRADIDAS